MLFESADEREPGLRAQKAFTDRVPESEAFRAAILAHEERVHSSRLGDQDPRRNVLAFFGVGGIGKTELSHMFESWTRDAASPPDWGPPPRVDRPLRSVRVDLTGSEGFDAGRVMLRVRAELGDTGVRFNAFDIGLAAFWGAAYPGQPLPALRASRGLSPLVGEQIHETLAYVLQEEFASLEGFGAAGGVLRTLRAGWKVTQRRRTRSRADHCPDLARLLAAIAGAGEVSRDDALRLAPLLRWDLGQQAVAARPQLIVFIDTYERVQIPDTRADQLIRDLAWDLPETLFVITGRNKVRWSEKAARALERTGPRTWPGLVDGARDEPRQHLVGLLSDEDADRYLDGVAMGAERRPLDAAIRARIVPAAAGLPLFLDLAVDQAADIVRRGDALTVDAFAETQDAVVECVVRDLDRDDRELLRVASLLANWDVALLAACGDAPSGRVRSDFIDRAFVTGDPSSPLPYRIHDVVRDSILAQEIAMGEWDADDWRRVGVRVLAAIQARCEATRDADEHAALIRVALEACARTEVESNWLRLEALRFRSLVELAHTLPPLREDRTESFGTHLHELLRCYVRDPSERAGALRELAESGRLGPLLAVNAWRHYAYRLRGFHDDYPGALEVFDRLAADSPINRGLHAYNAASTLVSLGRLSEARARAPQLEPERRAALESSIMRWQGRLDEAIEATRRRIDVLRASRDERNALSRERLLVLLLGLRSADHTDLAARVRADADRMGRNVIAAISGQIACHAGDPVVVERLVAEQDEAIEGVPPSRALAVRAYHLALLGDGAGVGAIERQLAGRGPVATLFRHIVRFWLEDVTGERQADPLPAIDWSDEEEIVRGRWIGVLRERRASLR